MKISGSSECSIKQMMGFLISQNPNAKSFALEFADLYLKEGEVEGVRGDVAFAQSLIETHYFKFDLGTAVTIDQNNFCGMGVTSKGMKGNSFATPQIGIRAQIQHLKAYANKEPLVNECVDPRFKYVTRGKANDSVEGLSNSWAMNANYGNQIISMIQKIQSFKTTNSTETEKDLNMVTIKQMLASKNNYGSARNVANIKYIVLHYTANDGASAENNGKYFANNTVKASAHYFVDDNIIIQSVPDNYVAWSVGGSKYSNCGTTGGGTMYGKITNSNSISIEMCDVNKNGKCDVTEKTLVNTIDLVKSLMQKYNIGIENVYRHFDVTGKSCPAYYVDNTEWSKFKNRIIGSASVVTPTANVYTQSQFVLDVCAIVGANNASEAYKKVPTISASTNKTHALVTPLERYMKALGYYSGSIEEDNGKKPSFGSGMTSAIKKYQTEAVKFTNAKYIDGILSKNGTSWKKLLGL